MIKIYSDTISRWNLKYIQLLNFEFRSHYILHFNQWLYFKYKHWIWVWRYFKGVAGHGSQTKGWGEGVWLKAEKKKVTPINSMLEVVSDMPLATSDGFRWVRVSTCVVVRMLTLRTITPLSMLWILTRHHHPPPHFILPARYYDPDNHNCETFGRGASFTKSTPNVEASNQIWSHCRRAYAFDCFHCVAIPSPTTLQAQEKF